MDISRVEFIHIPRTGGTTILTHLSELDPVRFNVERPHVTANQMNALDPEFRRKYSFAIVRNPYQRLVSIWQYELKRALGSKDPDFGKLNDFNVWLEYYSSNLDWGRSFMVLPQWFWITDWNGTRITTETFRHEHYDLWLGHLEQLLGKTFNKTVVTNKSMKQYDYKEIATEKSRRIMIELCSADAINLGYIW
jgi:Sulfotransferase family